MALKAQGIEFGWCDRSVRDKVKKDVYEGYGCAPCSVCLCSVLWASDWAPFHKDGGGTRRSGTMSCVLLRALGDDAGYRCVVKGWEVGLRGV